MEMPSALIDLCATRVAVVLTGAGVSGRTGIPTFRDADWPLGQIRSEELASPRAFKRNPKLVMVSVAARDLCAGSTPNPGHFALVEMERRIP